MTIASSVVEEKQSRVVEILVSAVPVRQLLLGKVARQHAVAVRRWCSSSASGSSG